MGFPVVQSLLLVTASQDSAARLTAVSSHSHLDPNSTSTDLLLIHPHPGETIGIDQARSFASFLSTHPISGPHKVVVILRAESLTKEAQNSLLKTLEEPPDFAQIILVASNPSHLLTTITSRCQLVSQPSTPLAPNSDKLPSLSKLNPGQRLTLSDEHNASREQASSFIDDLITDLRHRLKTSPDKSTLFNLTLSLYSKKLLNQNVNPKLTLDHLLIHYK